MNIIVAVNKNWGIGYQNKLLYNFEKDKEFFNEMTLDKVIVMGRITLENLLLSNLPKRRINICLTSQKKYKNDNAFIAHNLDELFEKLSFYNSDNVYAIGGESLYKQLLPYAKVCYVIKVDDEKKSDAFFENLDENPNWKMTKNSDPYFENNKVFYFCKYENKNVIKYNYGYEKDDLF